MSTLYIEGDDIPEGLTVVPDYISPEVHGALSDVVTRLQGRLSRNIETLIRFKAFGKGQGFGNGIPRIAKKVTKQLREDGYFDRNPDHMQLMQYEPGLGVPMHIDNAKVGDTTAGISLHSPCVMDLRKEADHDITCRLLLPPRSLYIMTGEARYLWEHGIATSDTFEWDGEQFPHDSRVSLTFRERVG
jgi:alkylated DNA repair protein alkB family protein 8